jgi:hypothetical protein
MKKITLLCLLSVICNITYAQLLVEDFDYTQGDYLTSHGWFTQYGASSSVGVTNGLTFENYAESNIGNAALLDIEDSNQLHKGFTETTSGNLYVAFMFQPTIAAKDGWFFSLRDNKLDGSNFNFRGRIFITTDNKIGLTFGNNANKIYSSTALNSSKTYLIVLKYTIISGENNDAVSLFVFDTFPESEPATAEIGPLTDNALVDINPANIILRSYSASNWLVIDGIRVAKSWAEAVKKRENTQLTNNAAPANRFFVTNNTLHLSITQSVNELAIFDLTGKCLTRDNIKLNSGNYAITLKTGIYILKMDNLTEKVIVK